MSYKIEDDVIIKLSNGLVVFGTVLGVDDRVITLNKPFTYIQQEEGIGFAPFEVGVVQGELSKVDIMMDKILYIGSFKDCTQAYNGYKQITSNIIINNASKILV